MAVIAVSAAEVIADVDASTATLAASMAASVFTSVPAETIAADEFASAMLPLSSSGWVRNRLVSATALNDHVHCGIDVTFLSDADTAVVAAAPTTVESTAAGAKVGPKTENAHPTRAPLYPHRPCSQADLSGLIAFVTFFASSTSSASTAREV